MQWILQEDLSLLIEVQVRFWTWPSTLQQSHTAISFVFSLLPLRHDPDKPHLHVAIARFSSASRVRLLLRLRLPVLEKHAGGVLHHAAALAHLHQPDVNLHGFDGVLP